MNDANALLCEFYDSSWSLLIKTLTPRKSGDGYKEDFKIVIYKEDSPRDFDFLSGGQKIMVESVLRQAIKLVNQSQKSDVGIAFCDESDGNFDPDNAQTYYNMLHHVHNEGSLHNTFVITHRKELINQLDQKIILENGAITIEC